MQSLRDYELHAIRLMAADALSGTQLLALERYDGPLEYEYTGCGYYLAIEQQWLPEITRTLSEPAVVGNADNVQCGFVLYLEPHKLVLECHTWGAIDVPEDFRQRQVLISTPEINRG